MPRKMSAAALDESRIVEIHNFRGHKFEITELGIGEYDALVERCTTTRTTNGIDFETTDNVLLLKLLVFDSVKCDGEPLTAVIWKSLGARLARNINALVNQMYYAGEPDELVKLAAQAKEDEDDDEVAEGNA